MENAPLFLLHALLLLLQHFIEFFGVPPGHGVDDRPDRQVAKYKNSGKHQYGRHAPFQPVVEQIGAQIAGI